MKTLNYRKMLAAMTAISILSVSGTGNIPVIDAELEPEVYDETAVEDENIPTEEDMPDYEMVQEEIPEETEITEESEDAADINEEMQEEEDTFSDGGEGVDVEAAGATVYNTLGKSVDYNEAGYLVTLEHTGLYRIRVMSTFGLLEIKKASNGETVFKDGFGFNYGCGVDQTDPEIYDDEAVTEKVFLKKNETYLITFTFSEEDWYDPEDPDPDVEEPDGSFWMQFCKSVPNEDNVILADENWYLDNEGNLTITRDNGRMREVGFEKIKYAPTHEWQMLLNRKNQVKTITYVEGTEIIKAYFAEFKNLTTLNLPSSLKELYYDWRGYKNTGVSAFNGCTSLKNVNIPENTVLDYVGTDVFPGSAWYKAQGAFKILGNNLVGYTGKQSQITIPDSVQSIAGYALSSSKLKMITIPDSVKNIKETAIGYQINGKKYSISHRPTIKCNADSVAHQYAIENGIPFKLQGITSKKITVRFNGNGGEITQRAKKAISGKQYGTLPSATRKGYTFAGWYTDKTRGFRVIKTSYVNNEKSHTLYARWKSNRVIVNFDGNGGKVTMASKKVTKGKTYGTLPTPKRKGYVFQGWYTAQKGGKKITRYSKVSVYGKQTLYAKWKIR